MEETSSPIFESLGQALSGNTGFDYVQAIVAIIVIAIAVRSIRGIVLPRVEDFTSRTSNNFDDYLVDIADTFFARGFVYFAGFVFAVQAFLAVPDNVDAVLRAILFIWFAKKAGLALSIIIDFMVKKWLVLNENNDFSRSLTKLVTRVAKFVVWALIIVTVLSNLGVNVIGFVMGLGVVGLVLPIALKDTFSDLFATVSIHADKPFNEGDVIKVGEETGTVEHIGIKTTHIRATDGHQVIVPNTELTSAQLINYGRRDSRRVLETITIAADTPIGLIEEAVSGIKKIIAEEEHAELKRVYPTKFNDNGFEIEWLYNIPDSCYDKMLTAQANINLRIKELLEDNDIVMPYQTYTVELHQK